MSRKRKATVTSDEFPMSSTKFNTFTACQKWLIKSGSSGLEDNRVFFGPSRNGVFGCFADRDFKKGDLIFEIPYSCLFGAENIDSESIITKRIRAAASKTGKPRSCTTELLIWLTMIESYNNTKSHHHAFLRSLDQCSPSLLNWPPALRQVFDISRPRMSTDVEAMLDKYVMLLEVAREMFVGDDDNDINDTWLPRVVYNRDSLLWAYSHYISRRYPGEYSQGSSILPKDCPDGREVALDKLGILVPALDILNHGDAQVEWLKMEKSATGLRVLCNFPRLKGEELWSNYGNLSNERLLFAYGFAIKDNYDDEVALNLIVGNQRGTTDYGLSYLRRGGLEGVPSRVWRILSTMREDEEENEDDDKNTLVASVDVDRNDSPPEIDEFELNLLLAYCTRLLAKYDAVAQDAGVQASLLAHERQRDERVDFIRYYLRGQEDILKAVISDIQKALEAQSEGDEEEEG